MQRESKRQGKIQAKFKLRPVLVPEPLWGVSACKLLHNDRRWKAIRYAELDRAGYRCATCRATTPRLYCHEQWHYDDRKAIATLTAFRIACEDCNRVLHMGWANARGDLPTALAHLTQMNQITDAQAKRMFDRASATWARRSNKHWRLVVAQGLIRTYPQLKVLEGLDTHRIGPLREQQIPVIRL